METGTHMDLPEHSRSRPGSYSALLNEILASPTEVPSPLLYSDDLQLPASATTDASPTELEVVLLCNEGGGQDHNLVNGISFYNNKITFKRLTCPL